MPLFFVSCDIRSQNFIQTKNTRIVPGNASNRTSKARSGIQCSAECTSDENCCSSSYDTHSTLCILFSTCSPMTEYAEGYSVTKKTPEPVPKWFVGTNLCFEWRADGSGLGQCGDGEGSNKLCASVNEWTTYYRDRSDDSGGGCQMRWSIESVGYGSWFNNVKICYHWISAVGYGRDPCGVGETCASVGTPTNYYRDDTDNMSKACQMQWMLSVPVDAPEWIQNAQLCYQWYTDDDKGQCGGEANGSYCAIANTFTSFYSDHTNENAGGCYMRWKIFVDT
ncbi:unnamed protein product [Mytilus edulis]|uniref:Apple domain-containing protein n=1 Tax=Mytilus edulis TaxID=6550 RepID=A0A8S3SRH8_MYTED|nr:unnamed protein product [Mytilus edulis]